MTANWLSVVGIGEDGLDGLPAAARALIATAEIVFGGERHLGMLSGGTAEQRAWKMPMADNRGPLEACRGRRVCLLATGDPMWFGIGSVLTRWFSASEIAIFPHVGAFSLAAARMGWALQNVLCLTVHGRPVEALALHFHPGTRLLVLSENAASPARVAALLSAEGFGASVVTVLEHLGGANERSVSETASAWSSPQGADLNTLAIEVKADGSRRILSNSPGLPDDVFLNDGQLTKREVRAVTLSALAPWPGALLWDVGAGAGSVAIEWMRAGGRAVAIERDAPRCARIAQNALILGVPSLITKQGAAPAALADLPGEPDAVFIGGGLTNPRVIETCWDALRPGGRLVANTVTTEGEAVLSAWRDLHGGDMVRLEVSRLAPTGRFHGWHPLMPITQYIGCK